MNDAVQKLKRIERKVVSLTNNFEKVSDNVEEFKSYSSRLSNGIGKETAVTKITNKLVKQLATQNNAVKVEETEERNKRTILVRKPADVRITSSKNIRSAPSPK